jgi:hypothetical protein
MTKFVVGLLLGLILGAVGAAGFLVTAGGGDYLVVSSPHVRELQGSLREADRERDWLREQLRASTDAVTRLESRFLGLATRFEDLNERTRSQASAPPVADPPTALPTPTPRPTSTVLPSPTPLRPRPTPARPRATTKPD